MNEKQLTPELEKINNILNRTVRPYLRGDGGDLELISLENNTLKIKYQGACGSCPHAAQGTLFAIEDVLKKEYSPDIKVQPA